MSKKYLIVVMIFIVVIGAVFLYKSKMDTRLYSKDCTNDVMPVFSYYPTDIENIRQIAPPIMRVGTGVKSHSYINVNESSPVYAPVDGKLITGAKYKESFVDPDKVQYTFLFEVSCEVSYYYDHIVNPPEKIASLFVEPASNETTSNVRFDSVDIKAGEVIGYSWSGQFDFGVLNNSKEPPLKDFSDYKYSEKAYADCPLNYYSGEMKERLNVLVGYDNMSDLTVIDNLCES